MATAAESKTDVKHVRGILKNTSSFDKEGSHTSDRSGCCEKEMKWDEMNILATYHPSNKDYGYQKITDPPTPYHHMIESEKSCDEGEPIDSNLLSDGLIKKSRATIIARAERSEDDEDDDDDDEHLTDEERAKRREFSRKRKLHYNEFQAVRLHRQMVNTDEDEEDEESSRGATLTDVSSGGDVNQTELDDIEVSSGTVVEEEME